MSEKLTVVLPTLNEEGNIGRLIQAIHNEMPLAHIVVVDDHSSDKTADVVRNLQKTSSLIKLIQRTSKPCLTDSIQEGINAANTDYVAWMDADLSHPPKILNTLLKSAQETGCAIASRFITDDGKSAKNKGEFTDTVLQSTLSSTLNFLVKKWLHLDITDYTSGYIVCRKDILDQHPLVGDYGEYFIDLVYFLTQENIAIVEIPYESPARTWGESKTGTTLFKLIKRGVKYLWLTIRLRFKKKSTTATLKPTATLKKKTLSR